MSPCSLDLFSSCLFIGLGGTSCSLRCHPGTPFLLPHDAAPLGVCGTFNVFVCMYFYSPEIGVEVFRGCVGNCPDPMSQMSQLQDVSRCFQLE